MYEEREGSKLVTSYAVRYSAVVVLILRKPFTTGTIHFVIKQSILIYIYIFIYIYILSFYS